MSMSHRFTRGALRVHQDDAEVLVIHADGRIVTRSLTTEGRLHVQEQHCPRLLRWLLRLHSEHDRLSISVEPLPASLKSDFKVRSVFALFVGERRTHPVILMREPLDPRQLRALLQRLPPVAAIINAGEIHIPRSSQGLVRDL